MLQVDDVSRRMCVKRFAIVRCGASSKQRYHRWKEFYDRSSIGGLKLGCRLGSNVIWRGSQPKRALATISTRIHHFKRISHISLSSLLCAYFTLANTGLSRLWAVSSPFLISKPGLKCNIPPGNNWFVRTMWNDVTCSGHSCAPSCMVRCMGRCMVRCAPVVCLLCASLCASRATIEAHYARLQRLFCRFTTDCIPHDY